MSTSPKESHFIDVGCSEIKFVLLLCIDVFYRFSSIKNVFIKNPCTVLLWFIDKAKRTFKWMQVCIAKRIVPVHRTVVGLLGWLVFSIYGSWGVTLPLMNAILTTVDSYRQLTVIDSWQLSTVDSYRQLTVIDSWQLSTADSYRQLTVIDSWQLLTADSYRQLAVIDSWQLSTADSYRQMTVIDSGQLSTADSYRPRRHSLDQSYLKPALLFFEGIGRTGSSRGRSSSPSNI